MVRSFSECYWIEASNGRGEVFEDSPNIPHMLEGNSEMQRQIGSTRRFGLERSLTSCQFSDIFAIVRRIVSFVALVALLLSFGEAPFSHLHTLGLDHSQRSGLIHQHERPQSLPDGESHVTSPTADDDAVNVGWTIAPPTAALMLVYAEVQEKLEIPTPSISRRTSFEQSCRLSEAPTISPGQTRAPPSV